MDKIACCLCLLLTACQAAAPPSAPAASPDPGQTGGLPPAPAEPGDEPIQPLPKLEDLPAIDPPRVALGERLFAEPLLSGDRKTSCLTCHPLERSGADGLSHSRGSEGSTTALNTLTIFNVGFNFRFNWSGRYTSL